MGRPSTPHSKHHGNPLAMIDVVQAQFNWCFGSQVPDGPILANGDMGVGVGDAVNENMSYYFGKMDFWTSNAFDGRRYA